MRTAATVSIRYSRRLITGLQDCVVQIWRVRFARIKRHNYSLVRQINFYIVNSANALQHRLQFAHTLVAIFAFSRDLDRFQGFVITPFRKKRIGRIGITGSCRVRS